MKSNSPVEREASLIVERIGGIDETTVELARGVNVLEGRNATNRTSLLQSIMAVLGSDKVALKGNAEEGHVELTIEGETYTRTIRRNDETTIMSESQYLDDPTLADLFAFLLESNEARRTVARSNNLYDIIMRPVDTVEIEREIANAEQQKDDIDDQLSELESRKERLPNLESERSTIRDEISDKQTELKAIHEQIESLNSSVEEIQTQKEKFKDRLTDLNDAKSKLEETERKLTSKKDQYSTLKDEQTELREERSELPTSVEEISNIGRQIGELQERKRTLGSLLDRLQNIIQFNEEVVQETDSELREALVPEDSDPTDRLLTEQGLVCWTCGSPVDRTEIESMIGNLQDLRQEKMSERREISNKLDELRERKRDMEKHQQRREQIEQQLKRIDDRIDQQFQRIEDLREQRDSMRDTVTELEQEMEEIESGDDNDRILELNKRENELTLTIETLELNLEEVETEIDEIEGDIANIPRLEDERKTVQEQLTELRNRIDQLGAEAVKAFNKHMENLITRLDYNNLERIWVERRESTVREGRQRVSKTEFDLHVVRMTDEGVTYEDTVDHLSESEREVTGLVFALAGYLVHDVHEEVPFMLLDSLEAIDAKRIATLVDYFEKYAEFLVIALLPEDAQAIDEKHHRVTDI